MSEFTLASSLRRLVALEGDPQALLRDARAQLRARQTQLLGTPVVVGPSDVDRALRLFEEGRLSREQLQEWAEILEMSDHVEYERGSEEAIANTLFRLTSPEINEPITRVAVRRMRASLESSRRGQSASHDGEGPNDCTGQATPHDDQEPNGRDR